MNLLYDPQNANFRNLSSAFWDKYSKEDTSWRDQPLWRYFIDKMQLQPGLFVPHDHTEALKSYHYKGNHQDFWKRRGHHSKYNERSDADAKSWFIDEEANNKFPVLAIALIVGGSAALVFALLL